MQGSSWSGYGLQQLSVAFRSVVAASVVSVSYTLPRQQRSAFLLLLFVAWLWRSERVAVTGVKLPAAAFGGVVVVAAEQLLR